MRDLLAGLARSRVRLGVALALGVVVAASVLIARLVGESGGRVADVPAGSSTTGAPATATPDGRSDDGAPAATGSPPEGSPDGAELPEDGMAGATPPAPSTAPPAAVTVAVDFTRAWADHPAGRAPGDWWAAVSAHSTPALAEQLRTTDPDLVPATRVSGEPTTAYVRAGSVGITVPTDAGDLVVTCVDLDGRWVVAGIDLVGGAR